MLNLLKRLFSKKTKEDKPFSLKVVPAWGGSVKYVSFEYSQGKKKGVVMSAHRPFLGHIDYDWKYQEYTMPLGDGDFTAEREMFSSLEKIEAFEKEEYQKYKDGQAEVDSKRQLIKQQIREAFERANQ